MGYQVRITARNVANSRQLAEAIAKMLQELTGSKPSVVLRDKKKDIEKSRKTFSEINAKLLKGR